jgi:hypothetical protein
MKTNAAIESSVAKEVPLDADIDELPNGSINFTPVGFGGEQLDNACIEKRYFELRTNN